MFDTALPSAPCISGWGAQREKQALQAALATSRKKALAAKARADAAAGAMEAARSALLEREKQLEQAKAQKAQAAAQTWRGPFD